MALVLAYPFDFWLLQREEWNVRKARLIRLHALVIDKVITFLSRPRSTLWVAKSHKKKEKKSTINQIANRRTFCFCLVKIYEEHSKGDKTNGSHSSTGWPPPDRLDSDPGEEG